MIPKAAEFSYHLKYLRDAARAYKGSFHHMPEVNVQISKASAYFNNANIQYLADLIEKGVLYDQLSHVENREESSSSHSSPVLASAYRDLARRVTGGDDS